MLLQPDGGIYRGAFAEGAFAGDGVYEYPDGSCYAGAWLAGRKHGAGAPLALAVPHCISNVPVIL